MAQTKRKRRRKHRGTQAGTVDRSAHTAKPKSKDEQRAHNRAQRQARLDTPPTWRGAVNRAAIAAALFGVLVIVAFGRPPAQGAGLAAFMFILYIPLGFATDRVIYNFRRRRKTG